MINMHFEQRFLQRISCTNDINSQLKHISYLPLFTGLCIPYLTMRTTIKQFSIKEAKDFPIVAPAVRSDVYMDNVYIMYG